MKKVNSELIRESIFKETLVIKRKRELFGEAKKINDELKQLNEAGHPGVMLGYGFAGPDSHKGIIGLAGRTATGSEVPFTNAENKPEECDCKLDQIHNLESEMGEIKEESINGESLEEKIARVEKENEELKEKFTKLENAFKN